MRAAHNLRALSEKFSVHLLVIAIYGGHHEQPSPEVLSCCAGWERIDASLPAKINSGWSLRNWWRWGTGRLPVEWNGWKPVHEEEIRAYCQRTGCVHLWVFRFYLLPWTRSWLDEGKQAWIDLDELESNARESQAGLLSCTRQHKAAARLRKEVEIYRDIERLYLPRFQRVITASAVEMVRLSKEIKLRAVEAWPNIVPVPAASDLPPVSERKTWKLLFIGSMGHFPNREAIHYAAGEILPRLQKLSELPVKLLVAGAGADAYRGEFADLKQIEWLGTVPDVAVVYAKADLVIVPVHAGGGTRIKILEAFAHRQAVVSSHIGAEGLEVVHDRELVLVDTPDEWAAVCAQLLKDEKKRERLGVAGYAYVTSHHGERNLQDKLETLLRDLTPLPEASPGRE